MFADNDLRLLTMFSLPAVSALIGALVFASASIGGTAQSPAAATPLDPLPPPNCVKSDPASPWAIGYEHTIVAGHDGQVAGVGLNGNGAACIQRKPGYSPATLMTCSWDGWVQEDMRREVSAIRGYIEWGPSPGRYTHRGPEQRRTVWADLKCPNIALVIAIRHYPGQIAYIGPDGRQHTAVKALEPGKTYYWRLAVRSDLYPDHGWHYSGEHRFTVPARRNLPPVAVGVARATSKLAAQLRGQRFRLDGSLSSDPDGPNGKPVAYTWKLGGETLSKRKVFQRKFAGYSRRYVVTLTVRDNEGATASTKVRLRTAARPTARPKPIPTDTIRVVAPNDVLFAFDRCDLSPRGSAFLRQLRATMRDAVSVSIAGHADSKGSHAYNDRLSRCRAETVATALLSGLVKRPKVEIRGYGERRPVASNATPEGRSQNRRVEITLRIKS